MGGEALVELKKLRPLDRETNLTLWVVILLLSLLYFAFSGIVLVGEQFAFQNNQASWKK
jgi:hypothetical protein